MATGLRKVHPDTVRQTLRKRPCMPTTASWVFVARVVSSVRLPLQRVPVQLFSLLRFVPPKTWSFCTLIWSQASVPWKQTNDSPLTNQPTHPCSLDRTPAMQSLPPKTQAPFECCSVIFDKIVPSFRKRCATVVFSPTR